MERLPTAQEASNFACSLLHLEPQDALALMHATADQAVPQRLSLLEGQMYEEIHSQALARRCLEHYHASAIAGATALHAHDNSSRIQVRLMLPPCGQCPASDGPRQVARRVRRPLRYPYGIDSLLRS